MPSRARKKIAKKPSAKRKTALAPTRDRIVQRSIVLFNRHGVRNVSIANLAADLNISPGNLTYHFKHKRDLSLATLEVLESKLRVVLAKPVDVGSAQSAADQLGLLMQTFWDFRFFFNGLTHLLYRDTQIRSQFFAFRAWALESIERDITYLQTKGYFVTPRPPNSFSILADNLWGLLLHWLRMQQIESPLAQTPKRQAQYACSIRIWSLLEPWMEPAFAGALLQVISKLYD